MARRRSRRWRRSWNSGVGRLGHLAWGRWGRRWLTWAPARSRGPSTPTTLHLAIFAPTLEEGSRGRSLITLANGLGRRGWTVHLVVGRSAAGPRWPAVAAAVQVVELARGPAGLLVALVRYLRRERPAILLGTSDGAAGGAAIAIAAKYLARVDTRVTIRQWHPPSKALLQGATGPRWLRRWGMRLLYPWADGLLAASAGVADDLARTAKLPRSRITPLPPPLIADDLPTHRDRPPAHPWLREPPIPVILAIGPLIPRKDFETFLRAIAQVRARQPLRAVILGEGADRATLEQLALDLGIAAAVDFPGYAIDAIACLNQAAALVLSSRWEGCPAVILEALAVGTPVVATNCPHGPAELLGDGRYGHLVPVGHAPAIATAIEQVLGGDHRLPPPQWLERFGEQHLLDRHETHLGLNDLRQPLSRRLRAVPEGPWRGDRSRLGTIGTNGLI